MTMIAPSPHQHRDTYLEDPERSFARSDTAGDMPEDVWGELRRVLIDVGSTLSPEKELHDVSVAEVAVIAKDTERAAISKKLENELRQLQKQLAAAASSALRPSTVPSPVEHNEQMRQLEQQHYATGKALNEEQAGLSKKEIELGRCKAEKEEIASWVVGEEGGYDSKVLRLKLINDIGFRLIPNNTKDDTPLKIIIRNDAKEDVHTATIDKTRSKVHWANTMWNMVSE